MPKLEEEDVFEHSRSSTFRGAENILRHKLFSDCGNDLGAWS